MAESQLSKEMDNSISKVLFVINIKINSSNIQKIFISSNKRFNSFLIIPKNGLTYPHKNSWSLNLFNYQKRIPNLYKLKPNLKKLAHLIKLLKLRECRIKDFGRGINHHLIFRKIQLCARTKNIYFTEQVVQPPLILPQVNKVQI